RLYPPSFPTRRSSDLPAHGPGRGRAFQPCRAAWACRQHRAEYASTWRWQHSYAIRPIAFSVPDYIGYIAEAKPCPPRTIFWEGRSEEHTSELQSLTNL